MAKKSRKKEEDIDSYRHEAETHKNAVPVGLVFYDTSRPKKFDYNFYLAPYLIWTGSDI